MSAQIVAHREVDAPGRIPRPGRLRPAAIVVVGYLTVVSSLVLAGLLLTHVLVDGKVGQWDTTSTRWLSEHRNGFLDAVTGLRRGRLTPSESSPSPSWC